VKRALAALVLMTALALPGLSCGPACREIDIEILNLACDDNAQFRGEIHLDSRAQYETFLRDQCTPSATDTEVENRIDDVSFETHAVFAASRARDEQLRCIEDREVERVEVCDSGLRVTFRDDTTDNDRCPGRWTTAFSLLRDDLRTALADEQ
jgi:hypothetical protein